MAPLDEVIEGPRRVASAMHIDVPRRRGDANVVLERLRLAAEEPHALAAQSAMSGCEPIGDAEHSGRRAVVVLHDDLLRPLIADPVN